MNFCDASRILPAVSKLITSLVFPAQHIAKINVLVMSPDGKWVASGSRDGTIILRDLKSGVNVQQWVGAPYHDGRHCSRGVTSLAFSPDGRCLVSGGGGTKAMVWDLSSGGVRQVATLSAAHDADYNVTPPHVSACSWSPDGKTIATGFHDGTTLLWDAHTFRQLMLGSSVPLVTGSTRSLTFSPDGRWFVSGPSLNLEYYIWNIASASATPYWIIQGQLHEKGFPPAVAAFDTWSTRLLVPGPNEVKLVDVETGEELTVLGRFYQMMDATFSPDGTLVLTASIDGEVKLWDAYTGVELDSLEGHEEAVFRARFSPCGQYVASASEDGTVRLWRTRDGLCVATFSEHKGSPVVRIAFSPNGETLWSGDGNGTVIMRRVHDIIPTDK